MKRFLLLALFSFQAHAAYYQDVLVCDGGAATVRVDIAERRNFQLIIPDRGIKRHFIQTITQPRKDYSGSIAALFPRDITGQPRFEVEMIVNGNSRDGLFRSSDFMGFQGGENVHNAGVKDCAPHSGNGCPGSYGSNSPTFLIKREGNALRVEAWRPRNFGRYCQERDGYSLQCTRWSGTRGWEALELGNWYFRSCEQREILP